MSKEELKLLGKILEKVKSQLTIEGQKRVFEDKKKLRSSDLKEPQDPEEFTKKFLVEEIFRLFDVRIIAPEKHFEIPGGRREVDYAVESHGQKILIEVKPLNENLYKKDKSGAVNQVKGIFTLAEARENYDFGIATNGFRWIFINKDKQILDDLDILRDFNKIKAYFEGRQKLYRKKEEDISKKFYEEYRELLYGGKKIPKEKSLVNSILNVESEEEREEIAQILINRLIFIKFLQSMGLIKEDVLGYLSSLEEYELNAKLNQLFFEVLNTPEKSRGPVDPKFKDIPYLNGSLFGRIGAEKRNPDYKVRADILKKVVEFLNKFRFTHSEALEENGDFIDPEILGYIFERAMTARDRKGTGAFYTPRAITTYIAKNTVIPYLIERINEYLKAQGSLVRVSSLEDVFDKIPPVDLYHIWKNVVEKIKVCDNACGSGAFLLAVANTLFDIHKRFREATGQTDSDFALKKRILKSIYGVDINPRAIEIARLRLWLWVAESLNPQFVKPLPNLEYNLRVGNSLVGFIDLEKLKNIEVPINEYGDTRKFMDIIQLLKEKLLEYREAHGREARKLKRDIEELRGIINTQLNRIFYGELIQRGINIPKEEFIKLKPFHWGLEFYEVFDLEKPKEERGFDIIVGNPPYVASAGRSEISMKIRELDKMIFRKIYSVAKGQFDLYTIFIERSILTLKKNGKFGYIIPDAILVRDNNYYIRNFIIRNTSIMQIIMVGKCFVGVENSNVILLLSRGYSSKNTFLGLYIDEEYPKNIEIISSFPKSSGKVHINYLSQEDLNKLQNKEFLIRATPTIFKIFEFLDGVSYPLRELIEMKRGEELGKRSSLISKERKNREYLPLIAGEDFDRYELIKINKFIHVKHIFKDKKFYKKGKLVFRQTSDRIRGTYDSLGVITLKSVYNVLPNDLDPKLLLCILNSNLCSWFYLQTFGIYRKVFPQINQSTFRKIPIRPPHTHSPFITFAEYLLFLNKISKNRSAREKINEFIDKNVIDSLVYELYFKERFYKDGLYPEPKEFLLEAVAKHLKPINYDRWAELYWKKQIEGKLSEKEERELKELEEKNLKTVLDVVKKLQKDKEVMKWLQKIRSHEWVRVIEDSS
ncbi:hypothetical protein DRP07_04235 [Archaeoglobales archaeon]|nr:MAG: hypothetical protein DRP07_04235 [Archaeoglobales archaeon]